MFKDIISKDISKTNIDNLLETKKVFEWILKHPEYDYKRFIESDYSNEILYNYFKFIMKTFIL